MFKSQCIQHLNTLRPLLPINSCVSHSHGKPRGVPNFDLKIKQFSEISTPFCSDIELMPTAIYVSTILWISLAEEACKTSQSVCREGSKDKSVVIQVFTHGDLDVGRHSI